MSVPMKSGGMSKSKALRYTFLSGVTTGIGAFFGALVGNISTGMIGICLAFAAGAMLYIVSGELIPESNKISDDIKRCVEFKKSNLLKDPYPTGCHLIVCRNVLIYFTEEAKKDVYEKFNKSLVTDGCLFVGNTEQIIGYRDMGYSYDQLFFYRKTN